MMSEKKTDLRTQMRNSANQDPPNEDDLIDLIRIHMAFVELRNYRLANRVYEEFLKIIRLFSVGSKMNPNGMESSTEESRNFWIW